MAMCMSSALATRPVMAPHRATINRSAVRKPLTTRAAVDLYQVADAAEQVASKVGDVSAPSWVLPAGVVVVTLGSILSGYLLKPGAAITVCNNLQPGKMPTRRSGQNGTHASDEIKKRDAKSGRFTK